MSSADLPGEQWSPGDPLADTSESWPVRHTTRPYEGFIAVREDSVAGPDGAEFTRVVMESPGAVGVLVVDDAGAPEPRVLLLRQYRHAAGSRLLEIPAGLLDVDGEEPVAAAVRELEEEASLRAKSWSRLLQIWSSPGLTNEHWDVYLASDLSVVPEEERAPREHEEADMTAVWVPLPVAVEAILAGRIADSMAVAAVLALHAHRTGGVTSAV